MSTTTPAPTAPAPTTPLPFDNIQGDVLEGLAKKAQAFIFFVVTNPANFRKSIPTLIPLITTTTQALADQAAIKVQKSKCRHCLLKLVGTNVAFSQKGLTALGIHDDVKDSLFTGGQLADASLPTPAGLGDPGVVTDGKTDVAWDPSFKEDIHGCFLVTGDCEATITERLGTIDHIFGGSYKTVIKVDGHVRPGAEAGHEHFGFQDGLSQPAVTGFREPNIGEVPMVPGIILLGEPGDPTAGRPAWTKDSSFLVFRKLRQFVPEFNDFLAKNPIQDKGLTPAQGSTLLGARLVGRWKSGAPIDRDPTSDNFVDAKSPDKVNDFTYVDDPAQFRCPFTAHLRKMNPRSSAFPGLTFTQTRRIIRQGIPYGPEVDHHEAHSATSIHDRGLLFVCYQSVIGNGFNFLQKTWANNPNFPGQGDGFDGIIGQEADLSVQRTITGLDPLNPAASLDLPKQPFVAPLGGEYFLSPSISALKSTFS